MSGQSRSVTDSTHCINKAILHKENINHISDKVLDRQHNNRRPQVFCQDTFPKEFQVTSNKFLSPP
jgi:hypothetical protein